MLVHMFLVLMCRETCRETFRLLPPLRLEKAGYIGANQNKAYLYIPESIYGKRACFWWNQCFMYDSMYTIRINTPFNHCRSAIRTPVWFWKWLINKPSFCSCQRSCDMNCGALAALLTAAHPDYRISISIKRKCADLCRNRALQFLVTGL